MTSHIKIGDREPGMLHYDGEDLMRLSKQIHPDIPIVCISAYGTDFDLADINISKPISIHTIIARLKKLGRL